MGWRGHYLADGTRLLPSNAGGYSYEVVGLLIFNVLHEISRPKRMVRGGLFLRNESKDQTKY